MLFGLKYHYHYRCIWACIPERNFLIWKWRIGLWCVKTELENITETSFTWHSFHRKTPWTSTKTVERHVAKALQGLHVALNWDEHKCNTPLLLALFFFFLKIFGNKCLVKLFPPRWYIAPVTQMAETGVIQLENILLCLRIMIQKKNLQENFCYKKL